MLTTLSSVGVVGWSVLAVAALVVGFAKTAINGAALPAVALFAAVLPARASTGILLPLLIVGDVMAVRLYRRHADWGLLLRLLPSVVVGTLVGVVFVALVDDQVMRRAIGVLLLVLVGLHVVLETSRRRSSRTARTAQPAEVAVPRHPVAAAVAGGLAGFTTMVANAAGPVMSLYLLLRRVSMLTFLGTGAWFFLLINLAKTPFSVGLGLITPPALVLDLTLAPLVLLGGVLGAAVIKRISRQQFQGATMTLAAVSAIALLLT